MGRKRPVDPDTQYFKYLNRLRSAGRSNMYGAVPYLMRAFGLERLAAFDVVCRWVDAFDLRRAEAAAVGSTEVVAPLPPKPARLDLPVVVHRPRRASRAKPPANRKPVPDVRIRIDRKTKPRKVASTDSAPRTKRSRRR